MSPIELFNAIIQLFQASKITGNSVLVILVLLLCAILMSWGSHRTAKEREKTAESMEAISKQIKDLQTTVDLLVELHCKKHTNEAILFRKKLFNRRMEDKQ